MKISTTEILKVIKEEIQALLVEEEEESHDDRHDEGEKLYRSLEDDLPGASSKLSQWSLQHEYSERAKEMKLPHDAVTDAMGLAGNGKVHSDS